MSKQRHADARFAFALGGSMVLVTPSILATLDGDLSIAELGVRWLIALVLCAVVGTLVSSTLRMPRKVPAHPAAAAQTAGTPLRRHDDAGPEIQDEIPQSSDAEQS